MSRIATSKSQEWLLWFTNIDSMNNGGKNHEFTKDFVFTPGFIAANCTRCGQGFQGRYGKEVGPYDWEKGAWMVIRCDDALAINAERETKEEAK